MNKLKHIIILSIIIFSFSNYSYAASFTATTDGNWNDGATWGNTSPGTEGVDYPSTLGGDTVVIGGQKTVTIPAGHDAKASVTSLSAGVTATHTKLVINGSLTMQATTTLNNYVELNLGAGGILDIDNKGIYISTTTNVWLNWTGVEGSRAVVKSTTTGGKFYSATSAANVDINWSHVEITGLGNSVIGSGTTASQNISISNLYVHDNGDLQLLNNGMNSASTLLLENSDFRNPTGTNKYFIHLFLATSATNASRIIRDCTFDGGSQEGILAVRTPVTIENIVLVKTKWKAYGLAGQVLRNSFHWNDTEATNGAALDAIITGEVFDSNYFYATASNAHPIGVGATTTIMNNVFEALADNTNFILEGPHDANALNNISIGGNFFVRHNTLGSTNTYLTNNTVIGSNDNSPSTEALLLMTETNDYLSGTAEVKNNIIYNSDTANNQYGIYLEYSDADQVDYTDYNYWYGTPGGDVYDHYRNVVITGKTEGVTDGFGANDRVLDPNFVDSTRRISTWDASLSGPGTASNAITEMLKMNGIGGTFNSNYTPENLITYVKAGFRPRNAAFRGTSSSGGDVGALPVQNTAPSVTFGSIDSWNSGEFSIPYTLTDADSDTIDLTVQYSTDNSTWTNATKGTGGSATTSISSSPSGTSHTFVWDTTTDLPDSTDSTVWFRIRPSDGGGGLATTTSSSFGVDNVLPTITDITSTKADGNYGVSETIDINVTFSEAVTSSGNITITLETGSVDRTCTLTVSNSTTGSCNYVVQVGDSSSDLNVSSISGTLTDAGGNSMTNFTPTTNLSNNKSLVIATEVVNNSESNNNSNSATSNGPIISASSNFYIPNMITPRAQIIYPDGTVTYLNEEKSTVAKNIDSTDKTTSNKNNVSKSSFSFKRNLSLHMTGSDVMELQKYLNKNGFLVSKTGPGSPGNETQRFGLLTYKALIRFQEHYKDEVLTPNNLSKGTGFFGKSTRNLISN